MIGHNNPPTEDDVRHEREGWIAIHRAMRSHWLVGFGQPVPPADPERGAHSRGEAFIDLIMECRYAEGTVNNGGVKMVIQPGQLVGAVSWLASRWNWTPMTVRGFLDKLEKDGMISRQSPGAKDNTQRGKQATVITLCNYSEYQITRYVQQRAQQQANNKQPTSTQHASNNIYQEEPREQGNKETSRPAPAQAAEGLAGLNGCTDPMIADVMRWMNSGDEKSARKWLSSTVAIYGQDATKDAWIKLGTDMATGSVIAQPLATWAKIATRMRDERKAAPPTTKRDEEMRKLHALTVRR
jgi:hypothetical protein